MNITALTAIPRVFGTQLERLFSGVSHVKTGLTVTAVGVGSTFVAVAAGTGVTASGTAFSFIGGTLDMGPSASNPRYDLVVVASGASSPTKVAGTASNAPVPPALPAGALLLAITYLPANATDFTTGGFINDYTMVWGLGNGTAAVPSLPFTSDPTTGIYRIAAGRMGITISGAKVAEFGATYMAVGATPALTGAIRIPNAQYISARNGGDSTDYTLIGLSSGNIVNIANGAFNVDVLGAVATTAAAPIAIGTNPAAAGAIRLPNAVSGAIMARNAANTQSIAWGYLDSSNQLAIGSGGDIAPANITLNAVTLVSVAGSSFAIGGTPATVGAIRLPNSGATYARNNANTLNIRESMVFTDDALYIGNGASLIYTEAKLQTLASASGGAGIVLPHGSAPSSPINGDVWTTTSGLFARINGATVAYTATNPSTDVQTFTATGANTWNKPAGTPKLVRVFLWGSGGGGGGGYGGSAGQGRGGGGGGGAGMYLVRDFDPSVLGASETVTIGAGGTSGPGGSSANGTVGGAGANTTFGTHLTAGGGGGGGGGANGNGGGGGGGGSWGGTGGAGGSASGPGNPTLRHASITAPSNVGFGGASGGNGSTGDTGGAAEYGGAGGGVGGGPGGFVGGPGGSALLGGGAGGAGGGCNTTNTEHTGGAGGTTNAFGSGSGGTSGAVNGGAGGNGTSRSLTGKSGDGGGGGGGQDSGTGGVGGTGGNPGGGAGGGAGGTSVGGAGGVGGRGEAIIVTFF